MNQFKKRLDALEQAEQAQPQRNARFADDLLLVYGTPAEQAAAQPKTTRPEICAALDLVYAVDTPCHRDHPMQ